MLNLKTTNITCTFSFGCRISHQFLKNKLYDFEIKKNFMIIRIREPRATALMFESGSVSMSGTTSVNGMQRAARIFAKKLVRHGYKASVKNLQIRNIAFSARVPWKLNISKLPDVVYDRIDYSEGAAAATVHGQGGARFKFFHTGSIIVTGYNSINEAQDDSSVVFEIARLIASDGETLEV